MHSTTMVPHPGSHWSPPTHEQIRAGNYHLAWTINSNDQQCHMWTTIPRHWPMSQTENCGVLNSMGSWNQLTGCPGQAADSPLKRQGLCSEWWIIQRQGRFSSMDYWRGQCYQLTYWTMAYTGPTCWSQFILQQTGWHHRGSVHNNLLATTKSPAYFLPSMWWFISGISINSAPTNQSNWTPCQSPHSSQITHAIVQLEGGTGLCMQTPRQQKPNCTNMRCMAQCGSQLFGKAKSSHTSYRPALLQATI